MTIEIFNGPHNTPAIGRLPGPNGTVVMIYGDTPADWLAALMACIGSPPMPPVLSPGGEMVAILAPRQGSVGGGYITGYQYNPAADETNKALVAAYQAELQGWNARAETLRQAFVALFREKSP